MTTHQTLSTRTCAALAALIAPLLVATTTAGAGSSPLPLEPVGLARNGPIAFTYQGDVWTVGPDGSHARVLIDTPRVEGPVLWSPDGTRIAFWSFGIDENQIDDAHLAAAVAAGDGEVVVARSDGSDMHTLMRAIGWSSPCGSDLSWAPDSQHLAISHFAPDLGEGVSVITVLSADGGEPRRLVAYGTDPYWSPDGRTIAFHGLPHRGADDSQVLAGVRLVGADGSEERQLGDWTGSGCAFDGIDWSPDGTRVAFYDGDDGGHDVWVASVDGAESVRIGSDPADEYWPRWSPDGRRIAFRRSVPDGSRYVLTDPGGGQSIVTDFETVTRTQWSPDGRLLVGLMDGRLEVVDPDGTNQPTVVHPGPVFFNPSWQRLAP